jgi:rRNA maturation endonuclease Nob1
MQGKSHDQEKTAEMTKREPVGFRCDECRRWFPRTKREIVNEGWFCPKCGEEAQEEFDRAWERFMRD